MTPQEKYRWVKSLPDEVQKDLWYVYDVWGYDGFMYHVDYWYRYKDLLLRDQQLGYSRDFDNHDRW
jgi:hypothetical protein